MLAFAKKTEIKPDYKAILESITGLKRDFMLAVLNAYLNRCL
jgi:hypothetical protein